MKKILFAMLLCFCCTTVHSQSYNTDNGQYENSFDVSIKNPNNGGDDCTNRFIIYSHLSDNSSEVEQFYQNLAPIGNSTKHYSKTIILDAINSSRPNLFLKSIRIHGDRQWTYWNLSGTHCANPGESVTTSINQSTICYEKVFTDIIPHYTSSVKVTIKPVKINLYYFNISGDENSVSVLPDKHNIAIKPTQGFPSNDFKWEYRVVWRDKTEMWAPRYRSGLLGIGCRSYNFGSDNCNRCATDTIFNSCNLNGEGEWAYQLGPQQNTSWREITSHRGMSTLNIRGNDLPNIGDFVGDIVKNKKKIEVRINYGCGYSEVMSLDAMKSAPTIIGHEIIPNKCKGDNNANVKLKFSEALLPGEKISIGVPQFYEETSNIEAFESDNSLIVPYGFTEGTHQITLVGKYPDSGTATFTGSSAHTRTIAIIDPDSVKFNIGGLDHVKCKNGADGSIQINLSGGIKPYNIVCIRNNNRDTIKNITSNFHNLANLLAGQYTIELFDAKNCFPKNLDGTEKTLTATIEQPADSVTIIANSTHLTGYKTANGSLFVNGQGGSGGYAYTWLKNGSTFAPLPNDSTALDIEAGTYFIKVTDNQFALTQGDNCNGCQDTVTMVVTQPDSLQVQIFVKDIISCNGRSDGTLIARSKGGIAPYTNYKWEKLESGVWAVKQSSADSVLYVMSAGKYRVTASDNSSIKNTTLSPELNFIDPPVLLITGFSHTEPSCYDYSDGSVKVNVTGGRLPYSYDWNTSSKDTVQLNNIPIGEYVVTVTDSSGCTVSDTRTVLQPDSLTITTNISLPSAYNVADGQINVTTTGGTPNYSYLWEYNQSNDNPLNGIPANDTPYKVTVVDSHGCSKNVYPRIIYPIGVQLFVNDSILCSGDANGSLRAWAFGGVGTTYQYKWFKVENGIQENLNASGGILPAIGAGVYQVTATDIENNTIASSNFVFNSPDSLNVTLTQYNLLCKFDSDGWIEAHATGGTAPYSYSWSNIQVAKKAIHLEEGSYSLVATDNRGCFVNSATNITAPDELILEIHYIEPLAYNSSDASVWVRVKGGTIPYTYAWQGRAETTDSISDIPHGVYTVVVTDVNGCQKQITTTIPNPPLLEAFVAESRVISCNGRSDGQLVATSQGGVGNHQYTWYKKENELLLQLSTGDTLNNIRAGIYVLKVTDDNKIDAYAADFILTQPNLLEVSVSSNSIACNGDTDGWVQATVSGGTAPYNYQWTSGDVTALATQLTDDKYFVFVTDSRTCETKGQGEITVPNGLVVDTIIKHPTCYNSTDGSIEIQVTGGVAPYLYSWSNGETQTSINHLPSNNYWVKVTGANGCFKTLHFTLVNPEPIRIDLGDHRTLCTGQQITLNGAIADPAAQYQWFKNNHPFALTAEVLVNEVGTYTIKATDANGCKGQSNIVIQSSNNGIVADFAVNHKVPRGSVIKVVNTNYPSPEKIEWLIPDSPNIFVNDSTEQFINVTFFETGTYIIGMRSIQGACEQVLYKPIEVVDSYEVEANFEKDENYLKKFIVYPNPSNGQFKAKVILGETDHIRLRLINISGFVIDDRYFRDKDSYEIEYDFHGRQGIHILQLITNKINTSAKLVFGE